MVQNFVTTHEYQAWYRVLSTCATYALCGRSTEVIGELRWREVIARAFLAKASEDLEPHPREAGGSGESREGPTVQLRKQKDAESGLDLQISSTPSSKRVVHAWVFLK